MHPGSKIHSHGSIVLWVIELLDIAVLICCSAKQQTTAPWYILHICKWSPVGLGKGRMGGRKCITILLSMQFWAHGWRGFYFDTGTCNFTHVSKTPSHLVAGSGYDNGCTASRKKKKDDARREDRALCTSLLFLIGCFYYLLVLLCVVVILSC